MKEDSHVDGHSIKELRLRTVTGVTILAVQRGDKIHHNPQQDFFLRKGDIVLLIGKRGDIIQAMEYFESDRFLVEKYHR